jgi:hypothetical protein
MKAAIALGMALALGTGPALAGSNDPGWTASLGLAFGDFTLDNGQIDDSSTGFRVAGSYRFNERFALEAAWVRIDDIEDEVEAGSASLKLDGPSLSLLWYLPTSSQDIDLYAKAGLYAYDQTLTVGSIGERRQAEGVLAGGGLRVAVTERARINVGYDWYNYDDADVWILNIGVDYHFGL